MNIQQAYEDVKKFNSIAGNLTKYEGSANINSIQAQLLFIDEELQETKQAVFTDDAVELLDGACDLFVTVAGLLQKLEVNGFNVEEALKRVNENNLSKFPTCAVFGKQPSLCPIDAEAYTTDYDHVVFKRAFDGKVVKPTNFKPVNIDDCVPENFFGLKGVVA